jgi:hypothetical protein
MATGLDLSGGFTTSINNNQGGFVGVTQSPEGAFTVTSVTSTFLQENTNFNSSALSSKPITMSFAGAGFSDQNQTFNGAGTLGFSQSGRQGLSHVNTQIGTLLGGHSELVGWNEDGLLFELTTGPFAGQFFFAADPNAAGGPVDPSTGMPHDTTFNTFSNSSKIPFLLGTISVACFAANTLIATANGEVAVEDLKEGDELLTLSGVSKLVKWVGNRRVNCRRHPRPSEVMPVRIKAHAFGENLPLRDLLVSPGHSLYVDGVLIPAGFLVNGATVVQEEVDHIHYYHVELDAHDVVLAEGLPAESYLDDENRHAFSNGGEYAALHPDLDPKSWENACAPRVMAGPQLTEVRQRLIDQADKLGYHLIDETDVHLVADGEKIKPCHTVGMRHWFLVPAGARELQLNSNNGVPMHLIADHGDSRCLGVAVSEFKLDGATCELGQVFTGNPYPLESHNDLRWVWTDGSASLAIDLPSDAMSMVEVAVVMSMKSWSRKPSLSVVRSDASVAEIASAG